MGSDFSLKACSWLLVALYATCFAGTSHVYVSDFLKAISKIGINGGTQSSTQETTIKPTLDYVIHRDVYLTNILGVGVGVCGGGKERFVSNICFSCTNEGTS